MSGTKGKQETERREEMKKDPNSHDPRSLSHSPRCSLRLALSAHSSFLNFLNPENRHDQGITLPLLHGVDVIQPH